MDALLNQLKTLALEADEASRVTVQKALSDLQVALETPLQTVLRLGGTHVQLSALRISVNIGLLRALASSSDGQSIEQLAQACGVPSDWIWPVLNVLASGGLANEVGEGVFAASTVTKGLANDTGEAAVRFFSDIAVPITQALPGTLVDNGHRFFTSPNATAVQKAFGTDLPAFEYLNTQPTLLKDAHIAMSIQRSDLSWLSKVDFQKELGDWDASAKPVFVDIGGGFGRQCIEVQDKFPQPDGSVILQDQAEVFGRAEGLKGVTTMEHDFFQPQPVKGAKFYYMRQVLHDHPDENCIRILKQTLAAMGPESRLIVDDMVLPGAGVHWHAAQMNLLMAATHGAKERRADEWQKLLESAGFKVVEILTYSPVSQESVIVAAPA